MTEPNLFTMIRKRDESQISGTGRVIDGVVFHNGRVVICWRTEDRHGHFSMGIYDSFEAFKCIHLSMKILWLYSRSGELCE